MGRVSRNVQASSAQAPAAAKTVEVDPAASTEVLLDVSSSLSPAVSPSLSRDLLEQPSRVADRKVPAVGAGHALLNAALVGGARNEILNHRDDLRDYFNSAYIPNLDAPLGETVPDEMAEFGATLPENLAGESEETQYATVIQNIMARFKYGGYVYGRDIDTEGVREHWASPGESLADGGQGIDCEDFAFMAKEYGENAQEELGFGGRFVVVAGSVNHDRDRGHAICVYYAEDGNQYVIDGTYFESGRGNISNIVRLDDYTSDRNFEWYTNSDGTLKRLDNSDDVRRFLRTELTTDYEADTPPDVVVVEERGRDHMDVVNSGLKEEVNELNEDLPFNTFTDLFTEKREALGNLSVVELGAAIVGPLAVLGDLLMFRRAGKKVVADKRLASTQPQARAVDQSYHTGTRIISGIKGVLDISRYAAFLAIVAGAGALAAPVVALFVGAGRCFVYAADSVRTSLVKSRRYLKRRRQLPAIDETLRDCPDVARNLLEARIDYKLKLGRLSGSKLFGALKAALYAGSGSTLIATAGLAIAAGTLVVANPYLLAASLALIACVALLRVGEKVYSGALLRRQKEALFSADEGFIKSRRARITGKKSGVLARIGAAVNVFGWVSDAVDDKTRSWPGAARVACRVLLAPFYLVSALVESKDFREADVFERLGREYSRPALSEGQRDALARTAASYYDLPGSDVLLKWMSGEDMQELKDYAETGTHALSPLVLAYLRERDEAEEGPLSVEKFEALVEHKRRVLDCIKPKFGAGDGLVSRPREAVEQPIAATSI